LQKTNGLEKQKNGALSFRKYQTEEIWVLSPKSQQLVRRFVTIFVTLSFQVKSYFLPGKGGGLVKQIVALGSSPFIKIRSSFEELVANSSSTLNHLILKELSLSVFVTWEDKRTLGIYLSTMKSSRSWCKSINQ
jgi:hypothetical protein